MGKSIAAQLEAIKSFVHADSQPSKRPFTRPSVLFDHKEAADIDIETIWNIGIQGLEVLISSEERFQNYKNELFSHRSKELDRELMGMEENNQINASISSYLRLLSGFFLLPSALKTLEYLIRRYKVHVYNADDLILCALPYHDTHAFVRIVQILDTRNTKWAFLDGVKVSGAPPPRSVIVQQSICDKGILDVLCDYASPRKKFQPSKNVISFWTAVFFEVLGTAVTVNDDLIKRILPFVVSGLHHGVKGALDRRASSFLIIGMLVKKAALAPKLLNSLIRSVAEVCCEDVEKSTELQSFRLSIIVLINLVQLQKIDILPKKTIDILKDNRNLAGMLSELSHEFNIDKFLLVLMDSLIDICWSDECSQQALISLLEKVPLKSYVHHVVTKILSRCVKLMQRASDSKFSTPGGWVKKILTVFNKRFPSELCGAVNQFLQDNTVHSRKNGSVYKILCEMLYGNLDSSLNMSDSKIWLVLQHPKADVRCASLAELNSSGILKSKEVVSESAVDIQESLFRQLNDKDLTVVRAALSDDGLPDVIGSSELFDALQNVLRRCIEKLLLGFAENESLVALIGESTVSGVLSKINLKTIESLAMDFRIHSQDHMTWFVENCSDLESSKTLFFLVLFEALSKPSSVDFPEVFAAAFPFLKSEWELLVTANNFVFEKFNSKVLDWDCSSILKLLDTDLKSLNAKLIFCIFWRFLSALIVAMPSEISRDDNDMWVSLIKDLFVCFASLKFKYVFHVHLCCLVAQCKISPPCLLSKFFTEGGVPIKVQVESLQCFEFLCNMSHERCQFELLAEFPSVLVPLASDNQDTRVAAMNCIDGLCVLWSRLECSGWRNGSNATWSHFMGELLGLIDQQKTLILSDERFLPSMFASMLGSTCHNILVPQNIENRFDQSTKEKIIGFILGSALKLSNYGKLKILSLLKGIGKGIVCVEEVVSLLSLLLIRRNQFLNVLDTSQKLSSIEIEMLCLLLESCVMSSSSGGNDLKDHLLAVLRLDSTTSGHPDYVLPCITVLRKLSGQFYKELDDEVKEHLSHELVFLCRNANGDIQSAAREAILRIDMSFSTFCDMLDILLKRGRCINISESKKKKLCLHAEDDLFRRENSFNILSSLLDVLLLKKDITKRHMLISPLFNLLSKILSVETVDDALFQEKSLAQPSLSEAYFNALCYIQQTLLIILEDIITSLDSTAPLKENITKQINFDILIECAHSSRDVVTRNHVFSLLSSVVKAFPEEVFKHILDIVAVVGKSTITQIDSPSKHVFEDLISAIVPCWLSKTDNVEALLKIFMDTLPEVVEHRRLSIVLYLLRTLGEDKSLASLLVLLFHSLVSREQTTFLDIKVADVLTFYTRKSEYKLVIQICEQYSSLTWIPALVVLLQQLGDDPGLFLELFLAMEFTLHKLQDPELLFKIESGEDADVIQKRLEELMEQIVILLQLVFSKKKEMKFLVILRKELKEIMRAALRNITLVMVPSSYFRSITKLLRHADRDVGEKALGLLCETARDRRVSSKSKNGKTRSSNPCLPWLNMNESDQKSFDKMCLEIVRVLDDPAEGSNTSLEVAAVSAFGVLASSFPSNNSIFVLCLRSVARCISLCNLAVASSCLQTAAALINVLGPKALAELPHIMKTMMKRFSELFSNSDIKAQNRELVSSVSIDSYYFSVLIILEVLVDKLGGFLNPYLPNIIDLLVLHAEYVSGMDAKVESRASGLRKLLAERIPVRLALPPLLKVYPVSVNAGDKSLEIMFDMLATLVGTMDRSSIVAFHRKIFDLCLLALDLRDQSPVSVHNIDAVEKSVIHAVVSLTMKLTESMFRPLFIKSIEWAESDVGETAFVGSTDRAISFYGMVNKLAESHRSLFVPYFKHLLGSCIHYLSDAGDAQLMNRKKKKAKFQDDDSTKEGIVSIKSWHLRKLVLSCLHKCFLYDTGSSKFLDSSNFQVLLKPIVSQLVIEPPASLDDTPNMPKLNEVDDLLVVCIGQMAVTAGSDLLWKPLNHEVLIQTRSEKLRARMLGLRIVKYLVDSLKEEYLVSLAETIPFLGELLEDVEPCVKSLAQESLKEMESMSGESLRQYL